MTWIDLPDLGPRPFHEFSYGGEARPAISGDADAREVASALYEYESSPGIKVEWWLHRPTGGWWKLRRDTLSDRVLAVQAPNEKGVTPG